MCMADVTEWVARRKAVFDAVTARCDTNELDLDQRQKCTDAALYAFDNGESGAIAAMVGQVAAETIRKEKALVA